MKLQEQSAGSIAKLVDSASCDFRTKHIHKANADRRAPASRACAQYVVPTENKLEVVRIA